jgi:hypothetical protein
VGRHPIEGAGAAAAERAPHFLDLVGLAVERAAHHQKHPMSVEPSDLLFQSLGSGRAEAHCLHLAEDDPSGLQHDVPPHLIWALKQAPLPPAWP